MSSNPRSVPHTPPGASAPSARRPFRDNLPMSRSETRDAMRQQSQFAKALVVKREVGTVTKNPASRFEAVELFARLLEAPGNSVALQKCKALGEWADAAKDWLLLNVECRVVGATEAAAEERNGENSSNGPCDSLVAQFVAHFTRHLLDCGVALDANVTLDMGEHMRNQARRIEALEKEIADLKDAHSKAFAQAEADFREKVRFEVANAVAVAKHASMMLNTKSIHEVRNENVALHSKVTELRAEVSEIQRTIDQLRSDNEEKEEVIETLKTAFSGLQKVRDAIKQDADRELAAAQIEGDSQILRLHETIAQQAESIKEYSDALKSQALRHQEQLDRLAADYDALLRSLQEDCATLQREKKEISAAHLQLLEAHRDVTGRQTSVLAHLAHNSMAMVERQYQPASIVIKKNGSAQHQYDAQQGDDEGQQHQYDAHQRRVAPTPQQLATLVRKALEASKRRKFAPTGKSKAGS